MKILLTGNMGSGKSHLARQILALKSVPYHAVDAYRREHGDGSMAQEAKARAAFLKAIQAAGSMLIECMGLGDLGLEVEEALEADPLTVILLQVPLATCLERLGTRSWEVPYPGTPESALALCASSQVQYEAGEINTRFYQLAEGRVYEFPHLNAEHTQSLSDFIIDQLDYETD